MVRMFSVSWEGSESAEACPLLATGGTAKQGRKAVRKICVMLFRAARKSHHMCRMWGHYSYS